MASWDEIKAGIFAGESGGDYNALYGYANRPGGQFDDVNLTDMTLDDWLAFSAPSGEYGQSVKGQIGRVATPMGGFQVVGTTLRGAKDGLGLTGQERMTPEMQDIIGRWIYDTQGTGAWEGYKGPRAPNALTEQQPATSQNTLAQQPDPRQNALAQFQQQSMAQPMDVRNFLTQPQQPQRMRFA